MLRSLLTPARRVAAVRPPPLARGLRASGPAKSGGATDWETLILKSDHTTQGLHLYHKLNLALIGLGPLALMLSPSSLNFPVDLLLGVMIPLHGHVGGNDVISDYGKKISKSAAFDTALRRGLLGVTVVTFLGLLKINLQGPGVTESFKSVWRPRAEAKK